MKSGVVMIACLCMCTMIVVSCGKKEEKVGKLSITEKAFTLEKDGNYSESLNVNGKVKNIGPYDVRNVVITGDCKSCGESMITGQWFATKDLKTDEQKAVIHYLAPGAEEEFSFKDIAYYMNKSAAAPENLPEQLDVFVESFETVQE